MLKCNITCTYLCIFISINSQPESKVNSRIHNSHLRVVSRGQTTIFLQDVIACSISARWERLSSPKLMWRLKPINFLCHVISALGLVIMFTYMPLTSQISSSLVGNCKRLMQKLELDRFFRTKRPSKETTFQH